MKQSTPLFDAGEVAEDAFTSFRQALSVLTITVEHMDDDGLEQIVREKPDFALNFAARFPMYSDTLHLIIQYMGDALDSFRAGIDSIFEANAKQHDAEKAQP